MIEFELNEYEFIPLNKLLKLLNMIQSGGEANQRIEEGEVTVNDVVEKQKRKKLRVGDKVKSHMNTIIIR